MTDKEKITEMLTRAGLTVRDNIWRTTDDLDGLNIIGVEDDEGSVGFSFDSAGNLKRVWGRDW